MAEKTRIEISSHPDVHLRIRAGPFRFEGGGEASFALSTGDVHIRFEEIPLAIAIPFLPRRVVAGAIGPFGVHIRPFEAQLRAFGVRASGELAGEGSELDLHGEGACRAEVEIAGKIPEVVRKAATKGALKK
jgi:hypothetical protein